MRCAGGSGRRPAPSGDGPKGIAVIWESSGGWCVCARCADCWALASMPWPALGLKTPQGISLSLELPCHSAGSYCSAVPQGLLWGAGDSQLAAPPPYRNRRVVYNLPATAGGHNPGPQGTEFNSSKYTGHTAGVFVGGGALRPRSPRPKAAAGRPRWNSNLSAHTHQRVPEGTRSKLRANRHLKEPPEGPEGPALAQTAARPQAVRNNPLKARSAASLPDPLRMLTAAAEDHGRTDGGQKRAGTAQRAQKASAAATKTLSNKNAKNCRRRKLLSTPLALL